MDNFKPPTKLMHYTYHLSGVWYCLRTTFGRQHKTDDEVTTEKVHPDKHKPDARKYRSLETPFSMFQLPKDFVHEEPWRMPSEWDDTWWFDKGVPRERRRRSTLESDFTFKERGRQQLAGKVYP